MHSHQKRVLLGLLSHLPAIFAFPNPNPILQPVKLNDRQNNKFVWGAIGDSWASGVSYGFAGSTDYDGNKDECLRINHAYSVDVSKDNSWTPNGMEQEFHFAACSGSRLVHMIHEPINGHIQMEEVGERPSVITMQAGGNNAGFYDVASNCIFHDADKDYGAAFPEQGECTAAIERAHNYLTNPNQDHWLEFDVKATIQEIFDKELAKSNPDFRLYIIGYAHFFDVRDDATWCDDFTFNLPWHLNQRQNLKLDLRKQINGLVEDLNQGLRRSAESFGNNKIGYIDVSSGFDGGRFCEVGHNAWDQFFGPKVLLWNWLGSIVTEVNGVDEEREPSQEEFDNWLKTGKFTNDPNEITEGEVAIQSPKQGNSPGSALRPFHPKAKGHEVMAKAIIERFKKDLAPAPPLCTNADCCPSGCTCGPSGVPLCT